MSDGVNATREPLAIVGMSCRFPGGVSDPASFWKLLVERRSGIIPVPKDRWNRERWYHPNAEIPSRMITKSTGPPSSPAASPSGTPISRAMAVTPSPTASETRVP